MTAAVAAPRPTGARVWLLAARPATLPAAIVPVLVGTGAALHGRHELHEHIFLPILFASILIQVGTNFANDVFDFRRGADTERLGPMRVTQSGLVTPRQVLIATCVTFGLATLLGVYLVAIGGWPILAIGVVCVLAGVLYTGGPWPFGYHGLGDLVCFLTFGVLAVVGTAYLQMTAVNALVLWASIPVGCLVTAILIVNNLRDIDTDRRVGKHTLGVILGRTGTRIEYAICVGVAYAVVVGLGLASMAGAWWWLPLLSLPLAVWLVRYVSRTDGRPLNQALKRTGQLHLLFGVLFAVALWLG
ncbi:MAG: 1,4-dihydroxy-2-naphthoate polyprenyltransferase [Chloroflexi bacterium]|nr:1,4-dihydroxy-2-naphthoate polyprenyltransferase [Chloroflexota bacterium]MBV9894473.1 1,4-dihydroxy-2-naphthoate polyprenyltransferase [Chloroflexota bacterium]